MAFKVAERATASCEDESARFTVAVAQFTQQFANLYFTRLKTISPFALKAARARWGDELPFVKTLDAEPGVQAAAPDEPAAPPGRAAFVAFGARAQPGSWPR